MNETNRLLNETNRLRQIRPAVRTGSRRMAGEAAFAILLGLVLGLLAKLVDNPELNPIFDDIGGRLGIWVFTATLLAVFSESPKLAAAKVFAFFASLLFVYYTYTVFLLHFFPQRVILFWSIAALISPICAYIIWYAGGKGPVSVFLASLPITVLLSEGYTLRDAYLPVHMHYYLIPWLQGIYLTMAGLLLYFTVKGGRRRVIAALLAAAVTAVMLRLDVLGLLFGGMNGVL